MPLSPSTISALNKIAELAGSHKPVNDRLEEILNITRDALNIETLSLVTSCCTSGRLHSWHSISKDSKLDSGTIENLALSCLNPSSKNQLPDGCFYINLPKVDGYEATLIGTGILNKDESDVLHIIKNYLSILIENEKLTEALRKAKEDSNKRMEEIAAIYEIGQAVNINNSHFLEMIVAKAAKVMGAQACSLMLVNPNDGTMTIEASYGLTDDIVKGTRINIGEGIAGKVAQTGKPMLILDVAKDDRFSDSVRPRPGVIGSMCVPLRAENGEIIGVISIRRDAPRLPFTEDDLKLFNVFATHVALAISNSRLISRLGRKINEMSTISEVLLLINSTLDLELVLNQIVESITNVVGFDRCCVYLLDERTEEFVAGARKGYTSEDNIKDRVKCDEGLIGLAAKERIPIFSQASPIETEDISIKGDFLVAPIVVRDKCIGVVIVDNVINGRRIEPEDVELLTMFVSQAGIAVENARLYEAMEEKYSELNVLYEHSRNISAAYGLDNAAEVVVNAASKAVKCEGAGLLILDQKQGALKLQAVSNGLVSQSEKIKESIKDNQCVEFVRLLKSAKLLASSCDERKSGPIADMLNALAPAKSHLMIAPLIVEDASVGLLTLYRNRSQEFNSSELKLISIIASHAAIVLKNAINYDLKMRQRVLELSAIYEFSTRISSASNLEEALDSILAIVSDLVDNDESFIYAIDYDREVATVKSSRFKGMPRNIPDDEPLNGSSVISWAIKERKALLSPDITKDGRFVNYLTSDSAVKSLMAIPLIVQDMVIGVLSVHSYSPNKYSEDDVRTLSIIASQGAAIYKNLEALTALTSYTDNILSSIAAGVVALSSEGYVLSWNDAAERIVGISAQDAYMLHYEEVLTKLQVSQEDKDSLNAAIGHVLVTGETYQGYKLCFHPENQENMYINMSISVLLNSAGEQLGLVIIFEDVTHEIKMENEFRRMGELAAVGQLAASIAHELRNPLSSIKGAAQFLQKEYEDHSSIVEFLGIIIEEVNGLNKLTTEFLDFARPMELELKPVSVNDIVERTLHLMSVHIADSNVMVEESLSEDSPIIEADAKQIEQVLKNMFLNSIQAMPEGGVLRVETGPTSTEGAYIKISDTGTGIAPDKLDRIFQPFFTTKTKGTGLGLSVCHKIIENHGGRIEVSSEVGKGTTFKIILPKTSTHFSIDINYDQTMERRE